jgi:hypothetical protein
MPLNPPLEGSKGEQINDETLRYKPENLAKSVNCKTKSWVLLGSGS